MPGVVKSITCNNGSVTAATGGTVDSADMTATGVVAASYTSADITVDAAGRITLAANGSGGSGITQLTGEVTAGPGSGSQVATIANGAVVLARLDPNLILDAGTF